MRILVLGSGGLLGTQLVLELLEKGFNVTTMSRSNEAADLKLDPLVLEDLDSGIRAARCDAIVNMVAITSVEFCEQNPKLAIEINSGPAANFSTLRKNGDHKSVRWLEVSTDHLYHGPGPSSETQVSAVNVYAATKWLSEMHLDPDYDLILRTNFVGRSKAAHRESLTDWILRNSTAVHSKVEVLCDVVFSPISIKRLSEYISKALADGLIGVYNLGSADSMSKSDFDFAFAREMGLDTSFMTPIRLSEAKFLKARRPLDMSMNSKKLEVALDIHLPNLAEIIREVAQEYKLD